jgi:ABC-type phosphate transport system substrate-binding protein
MSKLPAGVITLTRVMAAVSLASLGLVAAPSTAYAGSYTPISGSGSSWASIAIDQWSQDVRPSGMVVNYNPDGSAEGRQDYMSNEDDFAGSDPPFNNGRDKLGGENAQHPEQGYSYVPDTAGGTAFIYHIDQDGHLVTNLRLTPYILFEIFTGKITNWDNSQITKVYGAQLPNLQITPVVRADGSGASYFLSLYFSTMYTSQWNAFCRSINHSITPPCGNTEFYPTFGNAKAENGSNNVMAYITSSYGNGSIGYDEYAYALNAHYPVVQVANPGGYFVGPTASNVAVALNHAVINYDQHSINYLQQDLTPIYHYKDPRNYVFSSYSYLIVPREHTVQPTNFSRAKGYTLSKWINFFLCGGQAHLDALGYSPLPYKLVQGGLIQNALIPGNASEKFNQLQDCNNPTMDHGRNVLLDNAPEPSPCQKVTAPLNCVVKNGKPVAKGSGSGSKDPKATATASATNGATGTGPAAGSSTDPTGPVTGVVVNLASDHTNEATLGVLTAVGILLAVAIPPLLAAWLRRRRGQAHG